MKMLVDIKTIFLFLTTQLFIEISNTQYNIVRRNPFKQLSQTLKTLREEECEGSVISLQCPEDTKVR